MAVEVTVPDMGESVIEATVARWMKQEGDAVSAGEPVVELETDKINLEVGAPQAGVLEKILRQAGETVSVGDVLATVAASAAGGQAAQQAPAQAGAEKAATEQPAQQEVAEAAEQPAAADKPAERPPAAEKPAGKEQASVPEAAAAADQAPEAAAGARDTPGAVMATPVALRMAQDLGIDLSRITPTGGGGRITKEDVQAFAGKDPGTEAQPEAAAPRVLPEGEDAPTPYQATAESLAKQPPSAAAKPSVGAKPAPSENGRETRTRMSRRRQTIARRLVEAQQTAAMLTTFNEIDMQAVMTLRKRRRESFKERYGVDLGFMSFFVKATIGALKSFPNLNAELDGDEIVTKHYYDIGVAIGAEEGLVVPVIRDADRLNFAGIEQAIRDFVTKVKEGSLTLEDLRGGTFTITNGGVYGSLMSTPILNPPQVGILGMHTIKERPVVIAGAMEIRPMMYVALSYDHRLVDGREAVQFLVRLKELIEDPEALLFG